MDQYVKAEILGRGTFGEVIKATHKEVRRGSCGRLPPPPAGRRLCQLVRAPQPSARLPAPYPCPSRLARSWPSRRSGLTRKERCAAAARLAGLRRGLPSLLLERAHAAGLLSQPASQPASLTAACPPHLLTHLLTHPTQGVNVTALREVKVPRELSDSPHLLTPASPRAGRERDSAA
jgi:hypothetical protein